MADITSLPVAAQNSAPTSLLAPATTAAATGAAEQPFGAVLAAQLDPATEQSIAAEPPATLTETLAEPTAMGSAKKDAKPVHVDALLADSQAILLPAMPAAIQAALAEVPTTPATTTPATDTSAEPSVANLPAVSPAPLEQALSNAVAAPAAKGPALPAKPLPTVTTSASPADNKRGGGQELPSDAPTQGPANPLLAAGNTSSASAATTKESLDPAVAAIKSDATEPRNPADPLVSRQIGQFEAALKQAETPLRATIEAPIRSQAFPGEFSDKVVWLAGRQSQWADLSLNPPQLGNLEVRLSLTGGDAGAQFYSPNPLVRDAIEAALPRLRELFAQAGIALGDAQVRDEAFTQRESSGYRQTGSDTQRQNSLAVAPATILSSRVNLGLVDLYA
jgi:flagellar hook-length control protein FliK